MTFCKFADDLTALVRNDAEAEQEMAHIMKWSDHNKLLINLKKTKEIVVRRARSHKFVMPHPAFNIEQVGEVSLLGVHFNHNLNFDCHINHVLQTVSQRLYLMQQLRFQGMSPKCLKIVFDSLVVSKVTYACSSYSGYLTENSVSKLQSICNKAYRYNMIDAKIDIRELFRSADYNLFKKMINNREHCLHAFLPDIVNRHMYLRKRGHNYELPLAKNEQHKSSYLVRCFYDFI